MKIRIIFPIFFLILPLTVNGQQKSLSTATDADPQQMIAPEHEKSILQNTLIDINRDLTGLEFHAVYKGDFLQNFSGGLERKGTFLGNLDLKVSADLETIWGMNGLKFSLYALSNHGQPATEFVGDTFTSSNIEAPNSFKIYEMYFTQALTDSLSILLGTRDLNADYNTLSATGGLINSAFGITPSFSQTGINGPSIFPVTSLALSIKYEDPHFYIQSGLFNAIAGDPDEMNSTYINTKTDEGFLHVTELGQNIEEDQKIGLGYWHYTNEVVDLEGQKEKNDGFYFISEKYIIPNLKLFFKYSVAANEVNPMKSSMELGTSYTGPFSARR